jgi:hypothetical protein
MSGLSLFTNTNHPILKHLAHRESHLIIEGVVTGVDSETQTMSVKIPSEGDRLISKVPINNFISAHGVGIRTMPIPGDSFVLLLRSGAHYTHIGYCTEGIIDFTQNKKNSKNSNILLQRYLESGEVQLLGLTKNEILLTNDGSILIKASGSSYIKLDDYASTLEGYFDNMKYEMDGVRIRAGNTRRPLKGYGREEDFVVKTNAGEVKAESAITDAEAEPYTMMKEFTVQVGTVQDTKGIDFPFNSLDLTNSSPQVGWMSMATQVVDEQGTPLKLQGQDVQFLIRTANGGGIAITADNSLYVLDYGSKANATDTTMLNVGKNATKLSGGEGPKFLRASANDFVSVTSTGIQIQHRSGAAIILQEDVNKGAEISISNKIGQNITLNSMGLNINIAGGLVNFTGKTINFNAESYSFGPAIKPAADNTFKAALTAALIDAHLHPGPMSPPIYPTALFVNLTGEVLAGSITGTGLIIS